MTNCRVCTKALDKADYSSPAPAMTSLSTRIAVPTIVHVCRNCGHVQSPDLPDVQAFYDHEYRISLQSDDHDQLYAIEDGKPVFRTQKQVNLLAELEIPKGAKVLDFGAAKAVTLREFFKARPDIQPHVFDVSEDYREHWQSWLPNDAQATYALPVSWAGKFDLITAHFVLEHVADPVAVLADLVRCLSPDGQLFFTVPDPIENSGDLLVADHLNHFVTSSIGHVLSRVGMEITSLRQDKFRGAHVVVAVAGDGAAIEPVKTSKVLKLLGEWNAILTTLSENLAKTDTGPIAIYGAGFYGALFSAHIDNRSICFLDRNPHLQGEEMHGLPVFLPEDCPDVSAIVVALNPNCARSILSEDADWIPKDTALIYPI